MEHSRDWKGWRRRGLARICLGLAASTVGPVDAQYPGRISTQQKAGPVLRSVAVLEWTGEPGKPSASRLIPVSVYDDGQFQDGGLYLARPEPLALDRGTEYELMQSGKPEGIFDVAMAAENNGDWFGYGAWKPLPPPEPVHALKPSKIDPEVVGDEESDRRPHFRKAQPEDSTAPGVGSAPPEDPDRPTLRKRPTPAPDDANTPNAGPASNLETATVGGDPDRPKLTRGVPKELPDEPAHLEGVPPNLEQMVAVSDSVTRPEHSLAYTWSNPDDATKMQALLQEIALQAIAKSDAGAKSPAKKMSSQKTTAAKPVAARPAAGKSRTSKPPALTLTDIQFHAFELTYSGGATLVLTARTAGEDAKSRYVTVVAQPDIYGVPQVLFTQVTRADDLDAAPRFRLIDAVDAAADNRGELLFELRGATTREFALYRVAGGHVEQMIATAPMPLGAGISN